MSLGWEDREILLDELGDYLSSGGIGTAGTDLFLGFLPDLPPAAVAVYETGGLPPIHAMSSAPGNAVVEQPTVQVVARAQGYAAARLKAQDAYALLDGLRERTINGVRYLWGEALQSPFLLKRDDAERELVAVNFRIVKELSTG